MKLYYSPGACSLASHIVMRELGLPYDLEKVDLRAKTTESGRNFLEINPKGYVPALETDEGVLLTENIALLLYLASLKPGLVPSPDSFAYFQTVEWLAYISTELHKNLGALFAGPNEAARERAGKRLELVAEKIAGHDYLQGERFTLPDAYLFTVLTWADKLKVDLPESLARYRDRVAERPAVKQAMEREGLLKTPA